MAPALLAARLSLTAVFLISAVSKVRDLSGFRRTLSDFGVPRLAVATCAATIIAAEFAIAGGLIWVRTAWAASLAAFGLLLLFTVAIAVNMALGRRPDCHCFGQLHSKPIGWPSLGRNFLFGGIASFVVGKGHLDPGRGAFDWTTAFTLSQKLAFAGFLVGLLVLGFEGWLLVQILAQQGRLLIRLDAIEAKLGLSSSLSLSEHSRSYPPAGLSFGQRAPEFSLKSLYSETITLDALLASGKTTLLVFVDPNCGPCNALLPRIGRWQRELAASITLAVIGRLTVEANEPKAVEHQLSNVLLQMNREVAEAYRISATPAMVLVTPDKTIGYTAIGPHAIEQMVDSLTDVPSASTLSVSQSDNGLHQNLRRRFIERPYVTVGDLAPPIELPDLEGKMMSLESFRGTETLVLFWNPRCGFCKSMLDDLKAWESDPPVGAPKLLIISIGSVELNRAQGLSSTIILESGFTTASRFGATGTPSAVLVDRQGVIASKVAIGASEVFALASTGHEPRSLSVERER